MSQKPDLMQELKGKRGKLVGNRLSRRERLVLDASSGPMAMATALYDFSVNGGAVGAITLGVKIPANAIITRLFTDALTSMTSGGSATVAISAGATSLKAATAFNDATLVGADAQTLTAVKISSESELTMTIAVAVLTAGKVRIFAEYIQSEA